MRIGIDAHIILPKHKRYNPKIARFTENLLTELIDADKKQEHTWVLFFDSRLRGSKRLAKFKRDNVVIKHFPFVHYRQYLPVLYSHMLVSGFLQTARLDVFHSPEGLIPFMYQGKVITTFHHVPKGEAESSLFSRTYMLGARVAFAQLCRRAKRIIVFSRADKKLLHERHGYPDERIVVIETPDIEQVDWGKRAHDLLKLYTIVKQSKSKKPAKRRTKKKKPAKKQQKKRAS